jgi:uncharacterized membrane protein
MLLSILTAILVFVFTILIATNKIKSQYYVYCIGIISLGLIYQTTMLGIYVVGSDIQRELFWSKDAMAHGWNPWQGGVNQSNTSIVIGILAPLFSTLMHVDLIWIYKAILPLFLIATPVLLFYAFKKQMGDMRAYFAVLFFMIMPVFNLEIAQIAKSMVAEFFFALMILALVSNWKWQWKGLGVLGSLLMTILCHYTVGIIALSYLFVIIVVRLIMVNWKVLARKTMSIGMIVGVFLICSAAFFFYYSFALNGEIIDTIFSIPKAIIVQTQYDSDASSLLSQQVVSSDLEYVSSSDAEKTSSTDIFSFIQEYLKKQEALVKVGVGLDFFDISMVGKIFRIIQYITELLIMMGIGFMLFNYKKYQFSAEFIICVGASLFLLICCIFVSKFSLIINMTRFYHMSLFFLAPMLVLGADCITKWVTKK